jgi:hypothetical protein
MVDLVGADGKGSGLYHGDDPDVAVIYELGTGRPMYYRDLLYHAGRGDAEVYYRYGDGKPVFYVVKDESGKHFHRFDRGPPLRLGSIDDVVAEIFPELGDAWRNPDGGQQQHQQASFPWLEQIQRDARSLPQRSQPKSRVFSTLFSATTLIWRTLTGRS